MDNLLKRGWTESTNCVLCGVEKETLDHLFTQYIISKFLIVMTLEGVQLRDLGDDVRCLWDRRVIRNKSQLIRTRVISLAAY